MKGLWVTILAGVALCGVTSAQQAAEPSSNSNSARPANAGGTVTRIAPGSVIPVELTKTVDAKKVKTGDQIEAKVTEDLKAGNGEVILPKDTKVMGHVTEAQARNKEQKESQIGMAFDRAVMRNGGNITMPMSIQAVIAPAALNGNNNGSDNSPQTQSAPNMSGTQAGTNGGRNPGMNAGAPMPTSSVPSDAPSNSPANTHQPITGNTQGIVGISNLKLSPAANPTDGSLLSSDKNNVKLEGGTMMLLRVNQ
jgi:hypothetical protein